MKVRIRDIVIALIMAAAVAGIVVWQKQSVPAVPSGTATSTTTGLTLEAVALHNTRADCWTVINGGVYDLTSWIPQHPGGEQAILGLCGTDGSPRFNGQHGGAATQAAILAGFKVGDIGGAAGAAGVAAPAPAVAVPVDDRGRGRGRGGDDN